MLLNICGFETSSDVGDCQEENNRSVVQPGLNSILASLDRYEKIVRKLLPSKMGSPKLDGPMILIQLKTSLYNSK